MEQFTLRDFGGGLNTSLDEGNLPANMTASLLNVDFLDSRAITRRNGYAAVFAPLSTATQMASPIDALYRFYKKGDAKYWLAVSGTALYSRQYVSTNVPLTRLECESATITGTHITPFFASFSGGSGVQASSQVSFVVPYSTSVSLKWESPVQASLKIDNGAWLTATAGIKTWSGLSATPHTIYVKPKAPNAKSMKMYIPEGGTCWAYRPTYLTGNVTLRARFYDNTAAVSDASKGISIHKDCTVGNEEGYGVQIHPAGYYLGCITTPTFGTVIYPDPSKRVTRSAGWHTALFMYDSASHVVKVYVDGTLILQKTASATFAATYINMAAYGVGAAGAYSFYLDRIEYNPVSKSTYTLLDDFDSITIWAATGSPGSTLTNDTSVYDTSKFSVYLDYVDYSAIGTFTKLNGTLTATTDVFGFATLNDKAYVSSAYDPIMSYDGTTTTVLSASGTTTGAFLVEKGRRLFSAGDATDPSVLRYTSLDKGHDWAGGGTIYLAGKDSGGNCTGLAVANGLLYYFSESRTFALDTTGTPDNWVAKTLSTSHGCIAPKSIAVAPNAVIFLSSDGVRAHGTVQNVYSDDGSAFTILSDNIKPTLDSYTDAQKVAAVGAIYKNRYWLAIGGDVYVCDLEKRTENNQPPWTKYSGHDIRCMCVTRADEYGLYAGSRTNGTIYQLDHGGSDNGSPIPMLYKTPPLAPKGYTSVKHWRHMHIAAETPQAQDVQVDVITDDISPPSQTVTFDAGSDIQPKRLLTAGRGRSAQVRLSSDGAGQHLTISELTMTYNPQPRVR